MYHNRNSAVYPDFCGIMQSKEQKLGKRLYMLISPLALTVKLNLWMYYYNTVREHTTTRTIPIKAHGSLNIRKEREKIMKKQ